MPLVGPALDAPGECEAVLRTLPGWFGIEESLLMYARDSARLPTFAVLEEGLMTGFLTLREHFPQAWEIHCVAVRAERRGGGIGRVLVHHAERWLVEKGVRVLQVKTVAAARPDPNYEETRGFYARLGFVPVEVFPELWGPRLPVLQLIKVL
jgi:GNAT superfamily N-acetyltransferase